MKISRIETFTTRYICLVHVIAEDGLDGWGQTAPYNADITAMILHRQVAPHAIGADAGDIGALVSRIAEKELKFPGSYLYRAIGGLDTALWDMKGKRAGKSVAELLGGRPRPLRIYGSSMSRKVTAEEEALRLTRLHDDLGIDAFKFRIGAKAGHDGDAWPGRTEAIVPAVSKALRDKADLLVDCNSCYSVPRAIEVGRMLEDHGIGHMEEPCPYWELEWTRTVREALAGLDVTGGEQDCELPTWRRMIEMRAVDVVQPDVLYLGGICRTLEVARHAREAGLPVTPHCANRSLVSVFTLHLMAAIEGGGPYVEFSIEPPDYQPWELGIYRPALTITDGRVDVPDGPGWGVEIEPAWLEAATRQIS
ncbi:MAG: mandelate racemase/muconate lactonizing enzyme family protein [Hyphomicrobiaceae bacterium]